MLMVIGVLFMSLGGLCSLGLVVMLFGMEGHTVWNAGQIRQTLVGVLVEVVLPLVFGFGAFSVGRRLRRPPPMQGQL
jgi:hypothetical protein